MSIFYLDFVNGNDANDGSNWANAWKTITSGATAVRIAPGDTIRIAKSPAPTSLGQNATWTLGSGTVTLTTPVTQTIDNCETAWTTGGAGITVVRTGAVWKKQGSYVAAIATDATITTPRRLAYFGLPAPLDLSGYQQISFWMRLQSTSTINAADLSVKLYSDAACTIEVESLDIPAILAKDYNHPFVINKGSALASVVQGIGIYANVSFASKTISFDNFIACKAVSSADSLTLQSVISKASGEQDTSEPWFAIMSIEGTTIILDTRVNSEPSQACRYAGTTETVPIYKRETIYIATDQLFQDSGELNNYINFEGGYNISTTEQDGDTILSSLTGQIGINTNYKTYISLNYISTIRATIGITGYKNKIKTLLNCNNTTYGLQVSGFSGGSRCIFENIYHCIGSLIGIRISDFTHGNTFKYIKDVSSNITNNISCAEGSYNIFYKIDKCDMSSGVGFVFGGTGGIENRVMSINTANNTTRAITVSATARNYIFNAVLNEAIEVAGQTLYGNSRIFSTNHDGVLGNHKIFCDGGLISSDATTRHTASGISWNLAPTSTLKDIIYPVDLSIAKVAIKANKLVTVKAWMKKSHATDIAADLFILGRQIAGIDDDIIVLKAEDTDWEELTLNFTPTTDGVVEILARAYWVANAADESVWVDDLTITQAL